MPVMRALWTGTAYAALTVLAAAALAACGTAATCGPPEATVERVIDGDTIVITGGRAIRYLGVDAPETTGGHGECYGANAAQLNAELVLGKTVQLAYDGACEDTYGRALAGVTVGGHDVNRLLIERGHACVLHVPSGGGAGGDADGDPGNDADADELAALEAIARTARRGLWGACDPIPCR
jgi:micrococcal nuclease